MPTSHDRLRRAIAPLIPLCTLALLIACTPSEGNAPHSPASAATDPAAGSATAAEANREACAKATSPVQTLICNDPALRRQQAELTRAEASAGQSLDAAGQARLQAEQQRWITHTRELCRDTVCLQQVFADRLTVLTATRGGLLDLEACQSPDGQQPCVEMLMLRDPNSQLASLNTLLAENGQPGQLLGCSAAAWIGGGRNAQIAANCTQETANGERHVQLCSNAMVGQFAIEPMPAAHGSQASGELLAFSLQHCAG